MRWGWMLLWGTGKMRISIYQLLLTTLSHEAGGLRRSTICHHRSMREVEAPSCPRRQLAAQAGPEPRDNPEVDAHWTLPAGEAGRGLLAQFGHPNQPWRIGLCSPPPSSPQIPPLSLLGPEIQPNLPRSSCV
ncbi:hypothetical protein DFH27DRAFT_551008 [Peziza echinospora]|nr:hypothetical protein DFH27DRAFT_551008 [Peziza echinospora]